MRTTSKGTTGTTAIDGVAAESPSMSLAPRMEPLAVATLTSERVRSVRRWLAELVRRARRAPRRVHYFHQVDDPYSHLAAQLLPALVARYDVELVPHLVGPPSDAAAPERERLAAFARRDATDVAKGYRLAFPSSARAAEPEAIALAQGVLARASERGLFAEEAARVGSALWAGDRDGLAAHAREVGAADEAEASAACEAGSALRERLGHYLGATFHYGGEWYWGVDRLHHLERRLVAARAARSREPGGLLAERPRLQGAFTPRAGLRLTLDFFASLRSPYTYVATGRVQALASRYPIEVRLRPVLPMVMRGLPVPRAKRLYIVLDAKREAEDAGVDFGRVRDPVGRPVERAFSLYPWARERGRAADLLASFMRAAWAEGVDTGSDAGLRFVVERAGLAWSDARAHLDGDGWRGELEENREALFALGLWGVPSFCLRGGDAEPYSTWGQDRLWRVEEEIRARLAQAPR